MRKWFGIILAGLLALLIIAPAGCGSKVKGTKPEDQDVITNKAVATFGRLASETVVSGKLEALNSANVVPKMSGKVAAITVDVGSEVAPGDLLLSLEAADIAALVDLYEAQLEKARNSDLPAQKNQAELALTNAGANLKVAEADYRRSGQLLDATVIPAQQFEQSERMYIQAKAAYEAAQNALDILINATIPETIRQCEAQLEKARADFANSVIRSPISGVVTARHVNPGEMASPTQPVITLVNLDPVVVRASVNEDRINKINTGQSIKIRVGSVRNEPFTGIVTNIALAADPTTRAYPVKIQIENPQHVLKPGMFAEIYLHSGDEEGVIIPREALATSGEKSNVWVIKDGVVSLREVVPGHSDGQKVIIKSGLAEGEEVAVTNLDSLKEGMKAGARG